jgi:hypothetical protein
MDWVWRNKGALTTVAVVTAFITNPEPFINGAVKVVDTGGEKIIRPVAETAAKSINWNLFAGVGVACLVLLVAVRIVLRRMKVAAAHAAHRLVGYEPAEVQRPLSLGVKSCGASQSSTDRSAV